LRALTHVRTHGLCVRKCTYILAHADRGYFLDLRARQTRKTLISTESTVSDTLSQLLPCFYYIEISSPSGLPSSQALTIASFCHLARNQNQRGDSTASLLMGSLPPWSRALQAIPPPPPPPPFDMTHCSTGNFSQSVTWVGGGREWFHSAFDPVLPRISAINRSIPTQHQQPHPQMASTMTQPQQQITELCSAMENVVRVSMAQSPDGSLDLSKKTVSNCHRLFMFNS
uniref:SH2 domain-containing protein n=1 Tax=Rodentolepis nana TaxID=102285 RepID=A0A0R3TB69_RODNA